MLKHKIDIGVLDRRIKILTPTSTVDNTGGVVDSFAETATVWAKVEYPKVGQEEELMAAKETAIRTIYATIRYYTGLVETNALRFESEDYDILNITEDGRRTFHIIEAQRRK